MLAAVELVHDGQLDLLHAWFLHFEKALRVNENDTPFRTVDGVLNDLRKAQKKKLRALAADHADLNPALE